MAKITLADARSLPMPTGRGYCSRGLRDFGEKYGIDWEVFVHEGIEEDELLATGDAMAIRLVEFVRKRDGR